MAPIAQTGANDITTAFSTSASALTANKPPATADGDLLVAAFDHRNTNGTITTPAGWTQWQIETAQGTFGLWGHPVPSAAAELATSYQFSTNQGNGRCQLAIFRVTGADLASQPDAAGSLAVHTGTTGVTMPAVTAVTASGLLLAVATNNTNSGTVATITAATGMTEIIQVNANSGSATSNMQVAQQTLTSSGSTGTRTATFSPNAANSGGFMVSIDPVLAPSATRVVPQAVTRAAFI